MFTARTLNLTAVRLVLTAAALAATVAFAEPQHTPTWWNNDDGRTFREGYGFDTSADPPDPTPGITPPWYPHIGSLVESTGDAGWISQAGGHQGVWGVQGAGKTGSVEFFVWNGEGADSEKHLWVQFDCYVHNGGVGGPSAKAGPPEQSAGGFNIPNHWEDLGDGWTRHWREWTIKPQPMWETITFTMATAESGGTAVIDNVEIGTHCTGNGAKCDASGFDFGTPVWPPESVFVCLAPEHGGYTWSQGGSGLLEWMPELGDHEGVMGMPGGVPADSLLTLTGDGLELPEEIAHMACQYDFFAGGSGTVQCVPELPPDSMLSNMRETYFDIGGDWQRCLLQFDVSPPPAWKAFTWVISTGPLGEPVGVDNILVSAGTVEPDDWYEDFDSYAPGQPLQGVYGWKGWDGDPAFDAHVASEQASTPLNSVEIAGATDLVQEFAGFDDGRWTFTAYQYIPSDFASGTEGQFAGTYFVLMNTYVDGGPHAESDWSVQMQFDSNDGMLKVYYGNGLDTVAVPYDTDRWVEIQVSIDLPADRAGVYYDGELVAEYPWTGGVLGGGGGAANVAALDLYANGSSPVYYDDLRLRPAHLTGDLNCDGSINGYDIDAFVLALTSPDEYAVEFAGCDYMLADINCDGAVNGYDIDPFVLCLTSGACPACP
jgi:hypothetical protein